MQQEQVWEKLTICTSWSSRVIGGKSESLTDFDWTWIRSEGFGGWRTTNAKQKIKSMWRKLEVKITKNESEWRTGYDKREWKEWIEVRMACNSSTRCAAVGGEGPRSADSSVDRSCFGETICAGHCSDETLEQMMSKEKGKKKVLWSENCRSETQKWWEMKEFFGWKLKLRGVAVAT